MNPNESKGEMAKFLEKEQAVLKELGHITSPNRVSSQSPSISNHHVPTSMSPPNVSISPQYQISQVSLEHDMQSMLHIDKPRTITQQEPKLNLDDSVYVCEWRQKRQEQIEENDKHEEEKHKKLLEKAQKEIESIYEEYRTQRIKPQTSTSNISNSPATPSKNQSVDWHTVFKRIDSVHRPKGSKDISRMRSILANIARQDGESIKSGASPKTRTINSPTLA